MNCSRCGIQLNPEAKFCHECSFPAAIINKAGYISRIFASLIDIVIAMSSALILIAVSTYIKEFFYLSYDSTTLDYIFILFAAWFYETKLTSSARQATYGKQWLKLFIIGPEQSAISFGKANVRFWVKFLSIGGISFIMFIVTGTRVNSRILVATIAIVLFMITLFTKRGQALHDFAAGTVVVKREKPETQ